MLQDWTNCFWHYWCWSCGVDWDLCLRLLELTGICASDCHYCCLGGFNCCLHYHLHHALFWCHSFLISLRLPYLSLPLLHLYLPCVRLYFWHHVMLLAFKDDNTTHSFKLCHLLCIHSMIIVCDYVCTSMHICTFMMHTNDITVGMCLCVLLSANSLTCYWVNVHIGMIFICVDTMEIQIYLCPCLHVTISLHYH